VGGGEVRYFLDTEFHETVGTIQLISISIVAEDGRELYCESSDYDWGQASEWLNENVKPHLWNWKSDKAEYNRWIRDGGVGGLMSLREISREVRIFCNPTTYGKPEFWGYYADYDWVVFCWLFGSMIDLPDGFPMFCNDLKQEVDRLGIRFPKQETIEHHALTDARWNKQMHQLISEENAIRLNERPEVAK
jgi:hypothetical protein